MLQLTRAEETFLKKLNTPSKIQDYLDSIPFNFEERGETCMSPRRVLQEQKAHCIEGAMLAAVALSLTGRKPLLLNLKVNKRDDDHVVALFQENGYWGAISKTNHAVLRYRDPVYKSIRELAMSYFHEYFLTSTGEKTMLGYSQPINLMKFGTSWITADDDVWDIAESIYNAEYASIIPPLNKKNLQPASVLERKAAKVSLP